VTNVNTTGSRRWWAAGALALSGVVIGVDGTVLSLALSTLAGDLHASTSQLQWFLDGYLLVLGAMMLPAGLLGDRFGRKRLLLGALALFGVGSLACAYAGTAGQLIAARVLLGLAAAFVLPLSLAVLPVLFDEQERQRALAVVAGSAIAAFPLGPLLGGWLLTHFWWGSVFLINVPVIALAITAVALLMPESRSSTAPRLDLLGILLSIAGLVTMTYGVIEAGEKGWGSATAVACMAGGAVLLVGFVAWERRAASPLVDLGLFRLPGFAWGTVLSTLLQFSLIGLIFAVPQYLRAVLGYDAMGAGLRLLPLIGGMIVGLAIGDRISRAAGSKVAVTIGFAAAGAGLIVAAFTAVGDGTGFVAAWLAVVGFGTGVALPPAMNAAIGRLTGERSGVGSALVTAIRQVGGTFGVAVLGSVLNSAYRDRLDLTGVSPQAAQAVRDNVASGIAVATQLGSQALADMVRSAFVHGLDVLLAISGGIAVTGAVLALAFLPGRTRAVPASPADPSQPAEEPAVTTT